jgi:D-3-phosphoglycerate dehydrogenase
VSTRFIDCPPFVAALYAGEIARIVPDLVIDTDDPDEDEALERLRGCEGAVLDHTYLSRRVLEACPDLKAIAFMGTGASSYIDLTAAESLGITVRTVRGYGDRSIAEQAVALMFAGARQIARMDRDMRGGRWTVADGFELSGKTLGVVGTGGIGSEMVRLGAALGMTVLAWNRSGVAPDLPCESCPLDDLLARARVVSLHLALNDETRGIIDRRRLALMAPDALLVNTARGDLVDEAALVEALAARRLGHAALDVFEAEPLPAGHPLLGLDNATLTAHAGFLTAEAAQRLLRMALEALAEELAKHR